MKDELGIIAAAHRGQQDLVIVSRGPAKHGHVQVGSMVTNSIVAKVDVEIVENGLVVTAHRLDATQVGPVSLVVI